MKTRSIEFDFFGDGMRIFLDYVCRQAKKNSDYKPHPLIRAMECALEGTKDLNEGECTAGFSGDGTDKRIYNPYIVVLEKKNDGIEVKEIRDLQVDKELPLDIMITIFRLQIHLDRIEGEFVNPEQMVNALNSVIPGDKFWALGDRWMEARDKFRELLKEGKIHIPPDPELAKELTSIKYDTPWEEYPNRVRCLIGSSIAPSADKEPGTVVITSPVDSKIEKAKVFESAMEFLIGRMADHFKAKK
ncbi:MAG: hypothetical protein ACE5IW_11580 [bacterium]